MCCENMMEQPLVHPTPPYRTSTRHGPPHEYLGTVAALVYIAVYSSTRTVRYLALLGLLGLLKVLGLLEGGGDI